MPEYKLHYECVDDGCVYCWDEVNKKWVKICPVKELPESVLKLLVTDKEKSTLVLEAEKYRNG